MKSTQLEIPPHVRIRKMQGEGLLLDLRTNRAFGLDEVGVSVWERLAERGDIDSVVESLSEEYAVDRETLERDVRALVQALQQAGLLVQRGTPGT